MGIVFGMMINGEVSWWLTESVGIETWISVIGNHKKGVNIYRDQTKF